VRLDSVAMSNDEVRMRVRANVTSKNSLCCGAPDNPYIIISKQRGGMNQAEFVRVY